MSQVHLEKITPMNWHDVEDLHVGKDQNFLADNVSSLALAGVIREAGFHVYTFGVYLNEEPIGFAMIGYDIPFDDENDEYEKYWFTRSSYFIWRFMIDERYQKQGYGRQALGLGQVRLALLRAGQRGGPQALRLHRFQRGPRGLPGGGRGDARCTRTVIKE